MATQTPQAPEAPTVRFNEDQADKILRLHIAGWTEEFLARQYGTNTAAITTALDNARALREAKERERDQRLRR